MTHVICPLLEICNLTEIIWPLQNYQLYTVTFNGGCLFNNALHKLSSNKIIFCNRDHKLMHHDTSTRNFGPTVSYKIKPNISHC